MGRTFVKLAIFAALVVILWFACSSWLLSRAEAAPVLSTIDGKFSDGTTRTITGSDFGAVTIDIEWTGGNTGLTESMAAGSLIWDTQSPPSGFGRTENSNPGQQHVTTTKPHCRTKSIEIDKMACTDCGFDYRRPGLFNEVYATWWVWFDGMYNNDPNIQPQQWKMVRITPDGAAGSRISQIQGSLLYGTKYSPAQPMTPIQRITELNCARASCYNCGLPPSQPCPFIPALSCFCGTPPVPCPCTCTSIYPASYSSNTSALDNESGHWTRYEMYARGGSGLDVQDGEFVVSYTQEGLTTDLVFNDVNICTRRDLSMVPPTACPPGNQVTPTIWQYFVWQNYMIGTLSGLQVSIDTKFWFDEIYLSFGAGKARIEAGNAATWAACTKREVQQPLSWTSTEISFAVNNAGNLGADVWLYVIDPAGNVSNGLKVQGAGACCPSKPCCQQIEGPQRRKKTSMERFGCDPGVPIKP